MSGVPLHGLVSVSGTPQPLSAAALFVKSWVLKAPFTNAAPIYVGSSAVSSSNGYQMDPGDSFQYELKFFQGDPFYPLQPSDLYAVGTAPDKVTWFASP